MKTYAFIIALLASSLMAKSQEIAFPDSLIGTWKYSGPNQAVSNDTLELMRAMSIDNKDEFWTFRPYRNRLEITLKSKSNGPNEMIAIATKIDNKWFYDKKTEILTIEINDYTQKYRIIAYKYQIIKLAKIK